MNAKWVRVIASVLCLAVIFGIAAMFALNGGGGRISPDDIMIEMTGTDSVPADEYFYYVSMYKTQYESYMGAPLADSPEETARVFSLVDDTVKEYYALNKWAGDLGLALNETQLQEFDTYFEELRGSAASEEEFESFLHSNFLTEELFRRVYNRGLLVNELINVYLLDPANYLPVDDGEFEAYYEESGYVGAKHILVKNDEGDDAAANRALAEDILARLTAGEDFDTLMYEFSEDVNANGEPNNPEGYTNPAGGFVTEFEEAVNALEIGELSGIVEHQGDDYNGYHIILRIEPDLTAAKDAYQQIKQIEKLDEYIAAMNPVNTALRESLTIDDLQPFA